MGILCYTEIFPLTYTTSDSRGGVFFSIYSVNPPFYMSSSPSFLFDTGVSRIELVAGHLKNVQVGLFTTLSLAASGNTKGEKLKVLSLCRMPLQINVRVCQECT